jgi:hypothetical protein
VEIFLQLYDDLDDLGGVVGLLWRRVLSFVLACAAFIATGVVCVLVPQVLAVTAAVGLSAALLEVARHRRTPLRRVSEE